MFSIKVYKCDFLCGLVRYLFFGDGDKLSLRMCEEENPFENIFSFSQNDVIYCLSLCLPQAAAPANIC